MKQKLFLGSLVTASMLCGAGCRATSPGASTAARGTDGRELPTIASATAGWERRDGFLPLYVDAAEARVYLEFPPPDPRTGIAAEALYVEGLTTGLGSNPVGLDRGQLGPTRVVRLRRVGRRAVVEEPNARFRAPRGDAAERRATEESFAHSVLWTGDVVAEDPPAGDSAGGGAWLVDWTPFVVRDAHGVAAALARAGQGDFRLSPEASFLEPASCLAFPQNLELEARLTFTSAEPGALVESILATPQAVSLVQHHSLVRLPEPGFRPRAFDPRLGHFSVEYSDLSSPLTTGTSVRLATRHRLQKLHPERERSRPVEPIVYYLDRGTPEPVRSALLEGARWWSEAFEAAGFLDAYRVELLPEGAHPLDVRYNVIQWVHRSTRGWSYGGSVVDPRTGEILKGHVTLGSLRVRQDRLLFEGLLGADESGSGSERDPVRLALARLRQLAAHEVGHTLGLAHNFAASTYGGRASVMDYPAPWVRVEGGAVDGGGRIDVSRAYGVGVGEWDRHAVRHLYAEFPPGADEAAELERIAASAPLFLTDADARPAGAAHPLASLWDNGPDPVLALEEALRVRAAALGRFGLENVPRGAPQAQLEEVLAPLYFHHRYQVEAAAKVLGGLDYAHAVRGAGPPVEVVPIGGDAQRRALETLTGCLDADVLDLPERVLALLVPRAPGTPRRAERFASATAPGFDALGAAESAADFVLAALLQRERAARLVDQHRRGPGLPGLAEVLDAILAASFAERGADPRRAAVAERVQTAAVRRLMGLAGDAAAPVAVRARVAARLERALGAELSEVAAAEDRTGHRRYLRAAVERFLERDDGGTGALSETGDLPPGSPIGVLGPAPAATARYDPCSASASSQPRIEPANQIP